MLNFNDIMETITMIQEENLDIRTITMGISLLDCADSDIDRACEIALCTATTPLHTCEIARRSMVDFQT